jgi:hypothetical protein
MFKIPSTSNYKNCNMIAQNLLDNQIVYIRRKVGPVKGCESKYRVRSRIKGPAHNSLVFSFGQVVRIVRELSSQHV